MHARARAARARAPHAHTHVRTYVAQHRTPNLCHTQSTLSSIAYTSSKWRAALCQSRSTHPWQSAPRPAVSVEVPSAYASSDTTRCSEERRSPKGRANRFSPQRPQGVGKSMWVYCGAWRALRVPAAVVFPSVGCCGRGLLQSQNLLCPLSTGYPSHVETHRVQQGSGAQSMSYERLETKPAASFAAPVANEGSCSAKNPRQRAVPHGRIGRNEERRDRRGKLMGAGTHLDMYPSRKHERQPLPSSERAASATD